jgi:hypothetical protein
LVYLFNACTTDHKLQRWVDILMSRRLQIAAISSIKQIGLSYDQLVRDKECPATSEERQQMIQTTHAQGHFGSQAMFMRIWHNASG